jgi:hypothetical protein
MLPNTVVTLSTKSSNPPPPHPSCLTVPGRLQPRVGGGQPARSRLASKPTHALRKSLLVCSRQPILLRCMGQRYLEHALPVQTPHFPQNVAMSLRASIARARATKCCRRPRLALRIVPATTTRCTVVAVAGMCCVRAWPTVTAPQNALVGFRLCHSSSPSHCSNIRQQRQQRWLPRTVVAHAAAGGAESSCAANAGTDPTTG